MASVDQVFQLLKYRANKSGYNGYISSSDFNLLFPRAEIRYFNKLYGNQNQYQVGSPVAPISYPVTEKISTSISKFGSYPMVINLDASGKFTKPTDMLYVDSLSHYIVGTGGTAIRTINISVPGTGYTDGTYYNVPLLSGTGSGATATITVKAGNVTSVVLNNIGQGYTNGDALSANIPNGNGFAVQVTGLTNNVPTPVKRVEKQDLADNLFSYYETPSEIFPIYVEYSDYIQVYPQSLGQVSLIYIKHPGQTKWAFSLNGSISTLGTLTGGSGYVNGTYNNVPLTTNNTGYGALATLTVSGGAITNVTITATGYNFKQGDTLSVDHSLIGGSGTGFSQVIASIKDGREVYNSGASVDPFWSDTDIDEIIYICLSDIGINMRDGELSQFSQAKINTGI